MAANAVVGDGDKLRGRGKAVDGRKRWNALRGALLSIENSSATSTEIEKSVRMTQTGSRLSIHQGIRGSCLRLSQIERRRRIS
mmetsp:Transcript_34674/g.68485  ORF Transcript_34674/g.68485 Transcript_34674/m.68485 type:complete len:83 (-) Transcript_34674:92-340(-)